MVFIHLVPRAYMYMLIHYQVCFTTTPCLEGNITEKIIWAKCEAKITGLGTWSK
jgi:hypothetical protein